MKSKLKWKAAQKKLGELKPFEKNPRRMTEKGMADLNKSLDKFGLADPIIINTDGEIIGGHARYFALKEKNHTESINVIIPDRKLTEDEVKELNVRLNKNIAGEFDLDILAESFDLPDLLEWGFDNRELFQYDNDNVELKDSLELENTYSIKIKCKDEQQKTDVMRRLNIKKANIKYDDFIECQS